MSTKTAKRNGSAKRNGKPKTAPESPDILTLDEAAAFLRVPVRSLQAEVASGRVPGRIITGEWRFSKAGLLTWLQSSEERKLSGKEWLLSVAGLWKDDPTVDDMMKDIERRRKSGTVAGG